MYSPNDFNKGNLFQKFNGWIEWANQDFVENIITKESLMMK